MNSCGDVVGSCIGVDFRALAFLCCSEDFGAVLCESSRSFRQVGHASKLTLRIDLLVPPRALNSVVNVVLKFGVTRRGLGLLLDPLMA